MPQKIYEYVDVEVQVDEDGDVTIEGDGEDYLNPVEVRKLRDALSGVLKEPSPDDSERVLASAVSFNEGLLRLAAVHGKTVTFRYAKGEGGFIEQRTLKPQEVRKVGDHLTFIGYDPDRDDMRSYRVDRMKGEVSVA